MSSLFQQFSQFLKANPRFVYSFILGFVVTTILKKIRMSNGLPQTGTEVVLRTEGPQRVPFSEFLQKIEADQVTNVLMKPDTLEFSLKKGAEETIFFTRPTRFHPEIVEFLHNKKVPFDEVELIKSNVSLKSILFLMFPFLYLGACVYVFRNYINPEKGASAGKRSASTKLTTSFSDIAGIKKAKQQVWEITNFFRDPNYKRFGVKVPRGVLLVGPPGTGKTMMARALAHESGLAFFYCSGSDFIEVYSGRGAARVRSIFAQAKENSPSIIFIDEIDAIGKRRSQLDSIGSNDERDQTLNQLLSCMDGFDHTDALDDQVIVLAATNRYAALDSALTRSGRFDRIVHVDLPDKTDRIDVFRIHSSKFAISSDVDFDSLSILTVYFSAADIAGVCNEAAISAIKQGKPEVQLEDYLKAIYSFKESRKDERRQTNSNFSFLNQMTQASYAV